VDVVIIAFSDRSCARLVNPVRDASQRCEIHVAPVPLETQIFDGPDTWRVGGVPLIQLRPPASALLSWHLKRIFDVVAAAVVLVLVSPVLALTALAVRWETGPGVIFRQERVGRGGRSFTLYKFRSLRPAGDEGDVTWSIDNDSRMGPVGRIIRVTHLDELPQLINILKGDMSFVGPRPERPYFVDKFSRSIDDYSYRHRMPAGLTGFAVVHGLHGDTSIRDRSYFDNLYAESWSLWLDIKIMLRTAGHVVSMLAQRPSAPTLPGRRTLRETR
jgi:lipopolysaccharide/colanic/teichoic acid biosynthesis glycosyltransferase